MSGVPPDNTTKQFLIPNWQTCFVLSSETPDLLSFYFFTFLPFYF